MDIQDKLKNYEKSLDEKTLQLDFEYLKNLVKRLEGSIKNVKKELKLEDSTGTISEFEETKEWIKKIDKELRR